MSAIEVYNGQLFNIHAPDPAAICIDDIARSLAMTVRFKGHIHHFYSVAEHCVLGSGLIDPKYAMDFLLHDAGEAYMGDSPSPHKDDEHEEIEYHVRMAVYAALNLPAPDTDAIAAVKEVDDRLLATERLVLKNPTLNVWDRIEGVAPFDGLNIQGLEWRGALFAFQRRFGELV